MKFRRIDCQWCGHEGRPLKATPSRIKAKGMVKICASCGGPVAQS